MLKRVSAITNSKERRQKYRIKIFVIGIVGAIFILYIEADNTNSIQQKQISAFLQQNVPKSMEMKWRHIQLKVEEQKEQEKPEAWYATDRKLTDSEWEAMTQMILSEARGESFEVQYYIACVVLNRVDSEYFPDTVEGVIYQTNPVQFQGAWDPNWYEPSGSVLEAIQTALEENRTPSDMYYFTSEGWLPGTRAWKQVGGMWFSCQK